MSYTPLNVQTFVAAMSGSLAGIGIGERPITSTNPTDYNGLALSAFAYAQEFDTLWGSSAPDELEWGAILTASQGYWQSRDKESHTPSHYAAECAAIIAAIREGDAVAIAGGVTPPAWPPTGSDGTVTTVTATAPIRVTATPTTTPNIALTPPAYIWEDNAAVVNPTIAGVSISPTITPTVSGKLTVRVSGVVENTDTTLTHTLTLSITGTLGLDYVQGLPLQVPHSLAPGGSTAFSLIVALDKLPVPYAPPLNAAITFNVDFSADDDTHLTIPAHSVQIEVEERFA